MFYDVKLLFDMYLNKTIKPSGDIEYTDDTLTHSLY